MHHLAIKRIQEDDQTFGIFGLKIASLKSKRDYAAPGDMLLGHQRQLSKFINMLHDPYRTATFTIRTIINPHHSHQSLGKIDVVLLVKVPYTNENNQEQEHVIEIERNLKLILGGVFSNYIWEEIQEESELEALVNPLDWPEAFVAEIRRCEEIIQLETLVPQKTLGFNREEEISSQLDSQKYIYYVRSFAPPVNGFESLLTTLMKGTQKIVLTANLSPTELNAEERTFFHDQIAMCEGHNLSVSLSDRVQQIRAATLGQALLGQFMALRNAPFYLTFTVASQEPIDNMLLELVGLSLTEPATQGNMFNYFEPIASMDFGGYDVLVPLTEKDNDIARENMAHLSQKPWHNTHLSPDWERLRYLFNGHEAISVFYLPVNVGFELPGLDTFTMDELPLPRELVDLQADQDSNILIGNNFYFGFKQDVVIPEDTRRQHTYIIGQTGTGKTTLMKTMILSDMQAGNGLAVIDPHGELYQDILEMIPEERKDDVVLFDPSDADYPVGFNLLEVKSDDEREYIIKEMRAILNRFLTEHFRITDSDILGPIFFTHVQNNMLLAASDRDNPGTILEFYNIFEIKDYWKRWLPLKWKNRWLEDWVENTLPGMSYDKITQNGLRIGDYFSSKFVDFVNDPRINLIFGQPYSTIDLEEIVEKNKILLINLSKGLLGEANASMLGMMLMAKLNSVFMQRMKHVDRNTNLSPFYLYVDEFQNIATENFSILLAEARKFGLGLVLANQYMKQVSDHRILDAIIGNVGTVISFRLGVEDAEKMANQFRPQYSAQDISELPNYTAILRTNVKGERTVPCNFRTILTPVSENYAGSDDIINLSRENYTTPKNLADFLVSSSLAKYRMTKSEFYWEKIDTPHDQLLSSLSWKTKLSLFLGNEDKIKIAHKVINNQVMRKIFHFLTNEKHVSKIVVAQLLQKIEENDLQLIDQMDQYLVEYFEPAIGATTYEVQGVYNHLIRKFLLDRLDEIEHEIEKVDLDNKEDKLGIDEIKILCQRDHWLAAGSNIARMWKNKVPQMKMFEILLFKN